MILYNEFEIIPYFYAKLKIFMSGTFNLSNLILFWQPFMLEFFKINANET